MNAIGGYFELENRSGAHLHSGATPLHYKMDEMTANEIYAYFQTCHVRIEDVDLMAFAQKIRTNAVTIEAYSSTIFVGLCACYMNDLATRTAYITHIAIVPAYQGRGYSRQLLEHTIATARARGFVRLNLEVLKDNTPALHLYQSHHFTIIEDHAAKWLMSLAL